MDREISARIPTIGLPGFDNYPVVVADGEVTTQSSYGHGFNSLNTRDLDCIDGAPLMHPTMGHLDRFTGRNMNYADIMAQCDSGFSSGFSSGLNSGGSNMEFRRMADVTEEYLDSTLTPAVLDNASHHSDSQYSAHTSVQSELYDDEAYNSLTSLPSADMVFTQDIDGDTLLHMAIIHENEDLALNFIHSAEKVNDLMLINNLGQTPLHLGAYVNTPKVVDALIRSQVSLDTRNRDGNTALHLACREGHTDVARSLITAQPGLASVMNYEGLTCLHLAVKHNQLQIAALLIQCGASNVNAGDGCSGRTVLHQAVQSNQEALVQFLVTQCRADVNAAARDGLTPLMIAVGQQQQTIALFLQQHGAIYIDAVADDGFCSEDEMDFDASDLYKHVQHLNLNGETYAQSDEEDLYS